MQSRAFQRVPKFGARRLPISQDASVARPPPLLPALSNRSSHPARLYLNTVINSLASCFPCSSASLCIATAFVLWKERPAWKVEVLVADDSPVPIRNRIPTSEPEDDDNDCENSSTGHHQSGPTGAPAPRNPLDYRLFLNNLMVIALENGDVVVVDFDYRTRFAIRHQTTEDSMFWKFVGFVFVGDSSDLFADIDHICMARDREFHHHLQQNCDSLESCGAARERVMPPPPWRAAPKLKQFYEHAIRDLLQAVTSPDSATCRAMRYLDRKVRVFEKLSKLSSDALPSPGKSMSNDPVQLFHHQLAVCMMARQHSSTTTTTTEHAEGFESDDRPSNNVSAPEPLTTPTTDLLSTAPSCTSTVFSTTSSSSSSSSCSSSTSSYGSPPTPNSSSSASLFHRSGSTSSVVSGIATSPRARKLLSPSAFGAYSCFVSPPVVVNAAADPAISTTTVGGLPLNQDMEGRLTASASGSSDLMMMKDALFPNSTSAASSSSSSGSSASTSSSEVWGVAVSADAPMPAAKEAIVVAAEPVGAKGPPFALRLSRAQLAMAQQELHEFSRSFSNSSAELSPAKQGSGNNSLRSSSFGERNFPVAVEYLSDVDEDWDEEEGSHRRCGRGKQKGVAQDDYFASGHHNNANAEENHKSDERRGGAGGPAPPASALTALMQNIERTRKLLSLF